MNIEQTSLPSVLILTPRRFGDHRGFFEETWNHDVFEAAGLAFDWRQDNHSLSAAAGTVRGLHFQAPPRAQDKLVRCGRGALFDVAVDIRQGSPTYGDWVGVKLTPENGRQLLVPAGFAHGFMTLAPDTEIVYKCSDTYAPENEGALLWNDPRIGIVWPDPGVTPILSEKDAAAQKLSALTTPFKIV
ncbi:dTDP-4-dehydrorhamnose 3,5-epimerase [Roseivivax sp. THAF40]|uniref:dTDP-4-dehydrorhamnose 3,5-epimerase n=1 Tax=unclassified Roseivivax TaxID=2639302 RepID=UPI001267F7BA|nr:MULTISPECIES: dTDP-4-dehydrorhamnose 3,5-epimerase [unclassified Roseivivax]QFS83749.1 dTDP-4-dehydrorhamnose 3,5-epimerase [Roseivivax sp. THAF197b]QFT47551.1 dTDP-4-dehydrorhamnose 3,5-epimerase [Roseivivax sp. THAF40]